MPTEIPLTSEPSSIFEINLNGRLFRLQTKYNVRGTLDTQPYWTLDIMEDDQPVITGIVLVLGANLLRQYNLGIGGLVMLDRTDTGTDATDTSLGDTSILLYYSPDEIEAINV